MKLFDKIKSVFHTEHDGSTTRGKESSDQIDDLFLSSFVYFEGRYRYQPVQLPRKEYGDELPLSEVVDALMGKEISKNIIGLSICDVNMMYDMGSEQPYIAEPKRIRQMNVLNLLTAKNEDGRLYPKTGENVILTLTRTNGVAIVLFVRCMECSPYVGYIKVTSMVTSNQADDDLHSCMPNDRPVFNTIWLSFRTSQDDPNPYFNYFDKVEREALASLHNKVEPSCQNCLALLSGRYGASMPYEYKSYGDKLMKEDRPYDALIQYLRLFSIYDNPKENFQHSSYYADMVHCISSAMFALGDHVRQFYYLDLSAFFKGDPQWELLYLIASLADYRLPSILKENVDKIPTDVQANLKNIHKAAREKTEEDAKKDMPFLTVGFILRQLLRINSYNIFGMTVCRKNADGYDSDVTKDREEVWNYRFADLLADGNTIVFSYSRRGSDCGLEDDKSMLCYDNSVVMHINKIKNKDYYRIDLMTPSFTNDPDKLDPKGYDIPEYRTFVVATSPYEYDFSLSASALIDTADQLYSEKRTLEAMVGFYHAYRTLLPEMDSMTPEERGECIGAAAQFGSCFLEMNMMDVAVYYLNVGASVGYGLGEYLNGLVNSKDPRTLNILNNCLQSNQIVMGTTLDESRAFLRRRIAYVLIDWGEFDEAKELLKQLLADPLSSQFAKQQLDYLAKRIQL